MRYINLRFTYLLTYLLTQPIITKSGGKDEPFLRYPTCNHTVFLKPGLGVTQGHQHRHV